MPRSPRRKRRPVLELTDLRVARGEKTILDRINWRVDRGQHWVVLGPNGCGKTSLLRALTGYLSPTAGEMDLLGRRYGECDWRDLRFLVGIVSSSLQISIPPAEPAIETVISGKYAQLDLWANVATADYTAARKLLHLVGAADLENREWVYLSQGERQRVLIARALMAKPGLLILDEPCAGLDPVAREHFLGLIDRLARVKNGPVVVLVTHHVEEITPVFSHALLLREGRVVTSGKLRDALGKAHLSQAFGASVRAHLKGDRWQLSFAPTIRRATLL